MPADSSRPSDPRKQPAGFDATDILRMFRIRSRLIFGTMVLVVIVATAFVLQLTPQYSATAVVMLDQRKNNVEDTSAVLSGLPADQAAVQNQVQILQSQRLAGRVVDKLGLVNDAEFNPAFRGWRAALRYLSGFKQLSFLATAAGLQDDASSRDEVRRRTVEAFLKHLDVSAVGYSTTMNVAFQSESRDKAAEIANAIATAYVDDQLEAKYEATRRATQWLAGRIKELSVQAQAADAAVQAYKAENNITTTGNSSVVEQQIADINSQLILAKTVLAEKESVYDRLAQLAREGHAANAPQVMNSTLVSTLREQEAELNRKIADLSTRYTPNHPKMLDLLAQKSNLESKISEEVQRVVEASRNDVETSYAHVASLQHSLRDFEDRGAGQNQVSVKLAGLQSNAVSARAMYEAFLGKLNQTQNQQGIQTSDARLVSSAEPPPHTSYPNIPLSIGASIPAGFLLGLMLAGLAERLGRAFRSTIQMEREFGIPVLSTVPEVRSRRVADIVVDRPTSSYAEAVRAAMIGIAVPYRGQPPKVLLVTSAMPSEGKTTLAISLARVAASRGLKTVLVDGDFRRARVIRMLGLSRSSAAAAAMRNDPDAPIEQFLDKDPRSNVMVMACRTTSASPADVLTSPAMQDRLQKLRRMADLVIIDSAPILPVADTKIMCRHVDAVLLAIRWNKTLHDAVESAIQELKKVEAPIIGMVVTRTNSRQFYYYNYGYESYNTYNKYYDT